MLGTIEKTKYFCTPDSVNIDENTYMYTDGESRPFFIFEDPNSGNYIARIATWPSIHPVILRKYLNPEFGYWTDYTEVNVYSGQTPNNIVRERNLKYSYGYNYSKIRKKMDKIRRLGELDLEFTDEDGYAELSVFEVPCCIGRVWLNAGLVSVWDESASYGDGISLPFTKKLAIALRDLLKNYPRDGYHKIENKVNEFRGVKNPRQLQNKEWKLCHGYFAISLNDYIDGNYNSVMELASAYKSQEARRQSAVNTGSEKHSWFAKVPDGNGMSGDLTRKLMFAEESLKEDRSILNYLVETYGRDDVKNYINRKRRK